MAINETLWKSGRFRFLQIALWISILIMIVGIIGIILAIPSAYVLFHFLGEIIVTIIGMVIIVGLLIFINSEIGMFFIREYDGLNEQEFYGAVIKILGTDHFAFEEKIHRSGHKYIKVSEFNIKIDSFQKEDCIKGIKIRVYGVTATNRTGAEKIIGLLDKLLAPEEGAI